MIRSIREPAATEVPALAGPVLAWPAPAGAVLAWPVLTGLAAGNAVSLVLVTQNPRHE
jgi:hypothetical protein